MALDQAVMNVAISQLAADFDITVTKKTATQRAADIIGKGYQVGSF